MSEGDPNQNTGETKKPSSSNIDHPDNLSAFINITKSQETLSGKMNESASSSSDAFERLRQEEPPMPEGYEHGQFYTPPKEDS